MVPNHNVAPSRPLDRFGFLELGERAADGFNRQTQMGADVGSSHGEIDLPSIGEPVGLFHEKLAGSRYGTSLQQKRMFARSVEIPRNQTHKQEGNAAVVRCEREKGTSLGQKKVCLIYRFGGYCVLCSTRHPE